MNEDNNEKEIVSIVSRLVMLIEDDSDKGENEVIENEVLDKVPIDAEVEMPIVMNKSAEEENILDEEQLKCENDNIEIKYQMKCQLMKMRQF